MTTDTKKPETKDADKGTNKGHGGCGSCGCGHSH